MNAYIPLTAWKYDNFAFENNLDSSLRLYSTQLYCKWRTSFSRVLTPKEGGRGGDVVANGIIIQREKGSKRLSCILSIQLFRLSAAARDDGRFSIIKLDKRRFIENAWQCYG